MWCQRRRTFILSEGHRTGHRGGAVLMHGTLVCGAAASDLALVRVHVVEHPCPVVGCALMAETAVGRSKI